MNYDNFCKVLARIERTPDVWDQGRWYRHECNTACCIAGHASEMCGETPPKSPFRRAEWTPRAAARWLEISGDFACWLFKSPRTLDDFRRVRYVEGTRRAMAQLAA